MFWKKRKPDPLAVIHNELRAMRGALDLQRPAGNEALAERVAALEKKVKEIDVLAEVCNNLVSRAARIETVMMNLPVGTVEAAQATQRAAARIHELHPGFAHQR